MRNNATALENLPCLLCIGPIEKKYILSSHKLFSFFLIFSEKEESKRRNVELLLPKLGTIFQKKGKLI